ncbi:MAG TPA: heme NO-binding protein [Cyanothece sp. UBA12306]|nr:heme NO-binding protein [Cyanothece sp. UBA12306]
MYGLINKAMAQMMCEYFGQKTWNKVLQEAAIPEIEVFISMKSYPDHITYELVRAASTVLKKSPQEIMQMLGQYWILYTAEEGYGDMLKMAGDSFPEFLANLDELHARVGLGFPKLQPPSFDCLPLAENSLDLHYYSHREGLAHLVIGLLQGLSERFNTKIEVSREKRKEEGDDHDEFIIEYQEKNQNNSL